MRTSLATLIALLSLAGCVSGTRTIVVREYPAPSAAPTPSPRPAPVPLPVPRRAEQLEVAVGAPASGRVPVQTSRAAYVAIFEIVPQQGVTLVHPSTPKQGRAVMSGLNWVPVWWTSAAAAPRPRTSNAAAKAAQPTRYIYALASDIPLDIPERAYEPGYLEQVLGPAAYRAASPQPAVRALSRRFAPKISDEQWAEDLFVIAPERQNGLPRVARVYCANGRVHEVPEDVANRAWCPVPATPQAGRDSIRGRPRVMPLPARPDSVVGHNGRRIGPPTSRAGRTANLPDTARETGRAGTPPRSGAPDAPGNGLDQAEKARGNRNNAGRSENDRAGRAAREKSDREKADKAASEKAEKERAEKERAEKDALEKAEKEKADKAASEKAEKEKADKDASDKARKDKARKAGSTGKP